MVEQLERRYQIDEEDKEDIDYVSLGKAMRKIRTEAGDPDQFHL